MDTKGYKTTEFWMSLAAVVLSFLLASGIIPLESTADKIIGIIGTVLTALGYTVSRSVVKKNLG
jgi:hypothetical protein